MTSLPHDPAFTPTHLLTLEWGDPQAVPDRVLRALSAMGVDSTRIEGRGYGLAFSGDIPGFLTLSPFRLEKLEEEAGGETDPVAEETHFAEDQPQEDGVPEMAEPEDFAADEDPAEVIAEGPEPDMAEAEDGTDAGFGAESGGTLVLGRANAVDPAPETPGPIEFADDEMSFPDPAPEPAPEPAGELPVWEDPVGRAILDEEDAEPLGFDAETDDAPEAEIAMHDDVEPDIQVDVPAEPEIAMADEMEPDVAMGDAPEPDFAMSDEAEPETAMADEAESEIAMADDTGPDDEEDGLSAVSDTLSDVPPMDGQAWPEAPETAEAAPADGGTDRILARLDLVDSALANLMESAGQVAPAPALDGLEARLDRIEAALADLGARDQRVDDSFTRLDAFCSRVESALKNIAQRPAPALDLTAQHRSFAAFGTAMANFNDRMTGIAERIEQQAGNTQGLDEAISRLDALMSGQAASGGAPDGTALEVEALSAVVTALSDQLIEARERGARDPARDEALETLRARQDQMMSMLGQILEMPDTRMHAAQEEFLRDVRIIIAELLAENRRASVA